LIKIIIKEENFQMAFRGFCIWTLHVYTGVVVGCQIGIACIWC